MNKKQFLELERRLIAEGHDADLDSFEVIRARLRDKAPVPADEFARQAIYVVLAGGFSQKTAKSKHREIMGRLSVSPPLGGSTPEGREEGLKKYNKSSLSSATPTLPLKEGEAELCQNLLSIFNNKNKINAIVKLWNGREVYRDGYYKQGDSKDKLAYLAMLPHIGKITANHLARNLGENVFKKDVWIERLLLKYGDDLLERLERETALPRGYIDVVLWKGCQIGLLKTN